MSVCSAGTPQERPAGAGGTEAHQCLLTAPSSSSSRRPSNWLDRSAGDTDTLEYLHDGDVATVAVCNILSGQLLRRWSNPEYGGEMARALFTEVYGYWTGSLKESRPKFHGPGLGP